METVAVIDIGSNAIRSLIATIDNDAHFVILKKLRYSIRLGADAFKDHQISEVKSKQMLTIFQELSSEIKKHKVNKIKACATSAMRDSKNGPQLIQQIKDLTNIQIEIIDGDTEAALIHQAVQSELHLDKRLALIVDIGGGSTEFTLSQNEKLIACKSINIGSVRMLELKEPQELLKYINQNLDLAEQFIKTVINNNQLEVIVGTGGNFRRLAKINKKLSSKAFANYMTIDEVTKANDELTQLSHDMRVKKFDLSDDRADVIVPASLFIKLIIQRFQCKGIYTPKVGLKEGILLSLV